MPRNIAIRPNKTDKCAICLELLAKKKFVLQLPCKHQYHFPCYRQWEKHSHTCPICRYYNFFQCYHYTFSSLIRNARYWPSYFNRVLSQLRYYFRKCESFQIQVAEVNTTILDMSKHYIRRQDDQKYYDRSMYTSSHKKNLSLESLYNLRLNC